MKQKVKGYIFSEYELNILCQGCLNYCGRVQDDTEYKYGRIILEDSDGEQHCFTDAAFCTEVLAQMEM